MAQHGGFISDLRVKRNIENLSGIFMRSFDKVILKLSSYGEAVYVIPIDKGD